MIRIVCLCLLLLSLCCSPALVWSRSQTGQAAAVITAGFTLNWTNITCTSKTQTTLQVVVNALLTRQSLIHDQVFKSLAELNADFVRFVPWFPYPRLGVAQLEPPSGPFLCGHLNGDSNVNNWTLPLQCPAKDSVINDIQFVSWGTPTGSCGDFMVGSCDAPNAKSIVSHLCLNQTACVIPVNIDTFHGDPCYGTMKQFAIQVTCSSSYQYSNWDFTAIDPIFDDFMSAVNPTKAPNKTVINFSTIPNWMYANVDYGSGYTDSPYDCSWGYNEGTQFAQPSGVHAVGEYYGRLLAYYINGEMTDRYGHVHTNPHGQYVIDTWEVLNEPEGEHENTPQSYTAIYDAVVQAVWAAVDPLHTRIKFMGLALEGHYEWQWYTYFLNASNHASPDIPIDYISFHFYASCNARMDANAYTQFFPSTDAFVAEVRNITAIRDRLSPGTRIDIDEIGVILPGANSDAAPDPPAVYWNAAAAMFAYLYLRLIPLGVDIMGQSQLMGYPPRTPAQFPASPTGLQPQFASVTELDWNTGVGNARYWMLKLLIEHFHVGDELVESAFVCSAKNAFAVQGFIGGDAQRQQSRHKILFVNKVNQNISVSLIDGSQQYNGGMLYSINELSGFGPAIQMNLTAAQTTFNLWRFGVSLFYPF